MYYERSETSTEGCTVSVSRVFNLFLHLLVPVCSTSLAPWVAPTGQTGALEGRGCAAYLFRPWQ